MADYRLSVSVSKRSDGRSATAMAAYRAGEAVPDHRTGKQHDYTRKTGVLYSEIIAPDDAPDWATDRTALWNNSETANRCSNAIIAREIQLSLPHEMTNGQRAQVARQFSDYIAQRYGVAVDLNIHAPSKDGDERNYHAHLMLCTRRFDKAQEIGLSQSTVREFDPIACKKAGLPNPVKEWRRLWEIMLNDALKRANIRNADGAPIEVTAASYQDRNSDQEPQIKEGPTVTRKKRRGQPTDRAAMNEAIKKRNEERQRTGRMRNAPKPFTNQPDGATLQP